MKFSESIADVTECLEEMVEMYRTIQDLTDETVQIIDPFPIS